MISMMLTEKFHWYIRRGGTTQYLENKVTGTETKVTGQEVTGKGVEQSAGSVRDTQTMNTMKAGQSADLRNTGKNKANSGNSRIG